MRRGYFMLETCGEFDELSLRFAAAQSIERAIVYIYTY